jgi:uncharacterized membrane protein YhaH (DUF805 family)
MMNWFLDVIQNKYAQFDGRARREEYWMYFLFYILIDIAVSIVGYVLHMKFLSSIFGLGLLIPTIAVAARRLHDINRSGWWQLLALIPIIGWIIVLIWYVTDSDSESNQYGPNPKS